MDLIECRCPHCRGLFRLPPEQVGTVIRCGRCMEAFTPAAEEEMIVPADVPTGPAEAVAPPPAAAAPVQVAVPVVSSKPVSSRPVQPPPPAPVPDEPTSSDRVAPVSRFKEREGWRDDDRPVRRRPRETGAGPALTLAALAAVGLFLLAAIAAAGYLVYRQTEVAEADPIPSAASNDPAPPPKAEDKLPVIEVPGKPQPQPRAELKPDEAVRAVKASTVRVRTEFAEGTGMGSGFFAGPPGYVVTNAHVVGYSKREPRRPRRIEVVVAGGEVGQRTLAATLFGVDADNDLALLRVADANPPPPLPFGKAADLAETQEVFIYGFPLGELLGGRNTNISVNKTTVSSLRRENGAVVVVQVAGGMHPGNSGGPLATAGGQVVGVCVAGIEGTQLHFAIAGETAEAFVQNQVRTGGRIDAGGVAFDRPNPRPNPVVPRPQPQPAPVQPQPQPAPVAPVANADKTVVTLPASVADVCLGGGGRFLILHLPATRQLAVFDAAQGKVVKYIPTPEDGIKFAAGQDKLFVYAATAGVLQRWNLQTFEREVSATSPVTGPAAHMLMGAGSHGPLLLAPKAGAAVFLDPRTLKPMDVKQAGFGGMSGFADGNFARVSGDGTVFTSYNPGSSPQGHTIRILRDGQLHTHGLQGGGVLMYGHLTPGPDGRHLFGTHGVFTAEGKPVGKLGDGQQGYSLPAAEGGEFYLKLDLRARPNAASLCRVGDDRTVARLTGVELPGEISYWGREKFGVDQRIHLVPSAKRLVVIPDAMNRLDVYKVDPDELIEKSGVDYLYVTSRPPAAVPGKKFDYPIQVRSKKGGVKYKLDAGPDGMTVGPDGRVTWDVPAAFTGPASVIVTVSDATGQEAFHTFPLTAAAEDKAVAAAPVAAPAPPAVGKVDPPPPAVPFKPAEVADNTVLTLPGTADAACLGGGGRYLILRLPRVRQLAVFDAAQGKVVRYLPLAEDGALVAAGMSKLFVLNPTAGVIQRWDLARLEREVSAPVPVGGKPARLLMGHAAEGPLYVAGNNVTGKHYAFLDPKTFREIEVKAEGSGPGVSDWYPPLVRVSADGRVYAWWHPGLSPQGINTFVLGSGTGKGYGRHESGGVLLPGPDGRTLFTMAGLFTTELKPLGKAGQPNWSTLPIPAASGPWYLESSISGFGGQPQGEATLTLKMVGDDRPLFTFRNPAGLDMPADRFPAAGTTLPTYDRVALIPDAELLVIVNAAGDKVHLHRFNLKDRLEKSGVDYLLVTSRPPNVVGRGTAFRYTPAVLSKKGGVKLKLDAGPPGMALVGGTTVAWDVPAGFADAEANVILTVTDATGQEAFHSFRLAVVDKADLPQPAPAAPAAPAPAGGGPKAQETDAVPYEKAVAANPPTGLKPCPLTEDVETRKLPSAAGAACVGGAGRYLILHLPKERQLAVFDVTTGQVARYLPVADGEPAFAAGRSVLVVYAPTANAFVRYSLATFEKEATVVSPVAGVKALGMGSATDGPVFALGGDGKLALLDPKSFRPAGEAVGGGAAGYLPTPTIFVSEDGGLVAGSGGAYVRSGAAYKPVGGMVNPLPTPDGRLFLARNQVFTAEGKRVGEPVGGHGKEVWFAPAAQGPYYLTLNQVQPAGGGSTLEVRAHLTGETRPIHTFPKVAAVQGLIDWHSGQSQPFERHVFLFPDAKVLVALPTARTDLVLHRFDWQAAAAKADIDYLVVMSRPPDAVPAGKRFAYTPAVLSKKGKVRLRLEAGPDGMTLADGTLTWDVPAAFAEAVTVVLAVSDASGQEVFHTFPLRPAR